MPGHNYGRALGRNTAQTQPNSEGTRITTQNSTEHKAQQVGGQLSVGRVVGERSRQLNLAATKTNLQNRQKHDHHLETEQKRSTTNNNMARKTATMVQNPINFCGRARTTTNDNKARNIKYGRTAQKPSKKTRFFSTQVQ